MKDFIAHVSEDKSRFHLLEDHLVGVAGMAVEFDVSGRGRQAGNRHDLVKFSKEFQERIRMAADPEIHIETKQGRVNHPTEGGIWAVEKMKVQDRVLAYLPTGHHAGLR